MDLKYLIKNKDLIINSRKKANDIRKIINQNENSMLAVFFNVCFFFSFLLMNNKLINYTTSLIDPLNEVLVHTIGVSTALISFTLFSCLFYYILRKINQFKIKNEELFNIFENNDVGLSILNKKSLNKGKEIFKELSKEEKQFLLDKEKYDYLIINPKKMKETIFDYARNNKLSKEEQKDLNEIVKSYNLNLDQEKLDLLMFKNKKENCIISNNIAVKKI